jgi:signal transduction histidine kinase
VWRDWALVAVLVPTAVLEGLLRDDVMWRPVSLALGVGLVWTLLWRRTAPLLAVVVVFGALIVLNIASLVSGGDGVAGLNTMMYVLLLPYSLVRWGSGREIVLGLAVILVALGLGLAADYTGVVEAVAGSVFLLFPATLGADVRYLAATRLRELEEVKLRERGLLARELHDTVAHHVSAIVISAQAGRTLATSHPEAAADALAVIEREASRTLTEMRLMVGAMRGGGEPDLAPQRGVADLAGLARNSGASPRVAVQLAGDLEDLRPSLGAALYRLAQESITNAVRHARHATRIDVHVVGDDDVVRLTVTDDGDAGPTGQGPRGYGLVGMTERVTLLGGTLEAGPADGRGWTVNAVLPRTGSPG